MQQKDVITCGLTLIYIRPRPLHSKQKLVSILSRMSAACLSSSRKAKVPRVSCVFWSLELHISCGRSSHMTCTAAWLSHACHMQHMLAEAAPESATSQTSTCLSCCPLSWHLAALHSKAHSCFLCAVVASTMQEHA